VAAVVRSGGVHDIDSKPVAPSAIFVGILHLQVHNESNA
jgi:hypothetical protein